MDPKQEQSWRNNAGSGDPINQDIPLNPPLPLPQGQFFMNPLANVTATASMPMWMEQGSVTMNIPSNAAQPWQWQQNLPLPVPVTEPGSHVQFTFTCPCCQRHMVIDRSAGQGYEQVTVELLPEEEAGQTG